MVISCGGGSPVLTTVLFPRNNTCSGRSKNGCLYTTFFLGRLRLFPSTPVSLTGMADSGSCGGLESSCDSGGAGILRVVVQFRHESLTSFLCEDEAGYDGHSEYYFAMGCHKTDISTEQSLSSQVSGGRHTLCRSYVSQRGPYESQYPTASNHKEQAHNFTTVF